MVERKAFLQIKRIKYCVYPNVENMIVMPIRKRMEIVMRIQVCLISRMNFGYEENGGNKALLANPKHQYHVSQQRELDRHANNKKNGDYYVYRSLSHFMDEL